jgi:hypothetical protein
LNDILGLSWEIISDKRKLGKHPVINYSSDKIEGAFKITPDPLIFEKGISLKKIEITEWKGLPVFFQTSADSDIPFDIFAASFFLVTRYEEYLDYIPDKYGRYPAELSIAFRNGFLEIPVIDLWAKEMSKIFLKKFHTITFKRSEYKSLLTIDSDEPFAFLGKGLFRTLGGIFRDLKNHDGHVAERYRILTKEEKDPYQVFDYIVQAIEENKVDASFFFPVGDHSKYDKNPSWKNDEYRLLINDIAGKFRSGLHPSYNASGNLPMIINEVSRLNSILNKEVVVSRFHFIRLFIPQSYRDLLNAGLLEDYTMGYPDEPGYRAGIARPFYFYDIDNERKTRLKIVPFQVMDVTLFNYKKLDAQSAKEVILKLIKETRKAGGEFVSIWHNTSLLDTPDRKGWRDVFEFMLKSQT